LASRVQYGRIPTMLGTEYNWLISLTREPKGAPRASLSGSGLLTLAIAVFCFLCVALRAESAGARLRNLDGPHASGWESCANPAATIPPVPRPF